MDLFRAYILFVVWAALFAAGCANVVPPDGGPKDTTPPVLLSLVPADSQINLRPSKITLRFDKFMEIKDLEKHMSISPLLDIQPTVISYGKRVEIKIADTLLRPHTTYKLSLGNALTDNRENTPYADFAYIFSTGPYLDSLMYEGYVLNARTGFPDTGITVMLYEETFTDSMILRRKPIYVTRTDLRGYFNFEILPPGNFRLIAVGDEDNNYLYHPGNERMAFSETVVRPSVDAGLETFLYSFKEDRPLNDTARETPQAPDSKSAKFGTGAGVGRSAKGGTAAYTVRVDTMNAEKRTHDITRPLYITLRDTSIRIDRNKIFLSYDAEGIDAESVADIVQSGDSIVIRTQWLQDKVYTLRLVKGWATDSAANEVPPGKYIFRTRGKEDYSELRIHFNDTLLNRNYYAMVTTEKDTVHYGLITAAVSLSYLAPEAYTVMIFEDRNRDGKWTTGNFLERRQPEIMIPHDGKVLLRPGWENEIDFKPYIFKPESRKADKFKQAADHEPEKE